MILLNGQELNFKTFPNGETLVDGEQILSLINSQNNTVTLKYENDTDLIKLMFAKNYIDGYIKEVDLLITYMPYSRNDRSENGSAFTLKFVSDFINGLTFKKVFIIESHSDVTPALINNSVPISANRILLPMVINEIGFNVETDYIIYPDTTSNKRYGMFGDFNSLTGLKHRDFKTGKILNLELCGSLDSGTGKKALLIDDMSSFGGTFILTAEKLRGKGFDEIYLLVAHSEENIFNGKLFETDLINKVFTTDTILIGNDEDWSIKSKDRLKVYKIGELLDKK